MRPIAVLPSRQTLESPEFDGVNVDLLRVRLEQELPLPAVIAVTSATAQDGKELIARALAYSYALTGYSTLFIDTSLAFRTLAEPPRGLFLTDAFRRALPPNPESGKLAVLTHRDLTLHRAPSVRSLKAALEILRGKFDCVVISTESCATDAFAAAIVATADAHLVTVKKGRRQTPQDAQLAAELERAAGSRFLGVVLVDPAVITANSPARVAAPEMPGHDKPRQPKPGLFARVVHALVNRLSGAHANDAEKHPRVAVPEAPEPQAMLPGAASRSFLPFGSAMSAEKLTALSEVSEVNRN